MIKVKQGAEKTTTLSLYKYLCNVVYINNLQVFASYNYNNKATAWHNAPIL